MSRSIVTGGAGFVGANLVARLQARGDHVVVVDTFRTGTFANIVEACERAGSGPFSGEVVAAGAGELPWGKGFPGHRPVKAVFHLGAITDTTVSDEARMLRENVAGFDAMLHWGAGAGVPVVYASSAATYGTPPQAAERTPFPEAAAGRPSNVYGFSKWMMEKVHERVWRELSRESPVFCVHPEERVGPHFVGLRYFNVFGPGESRKGKMASMVLQLADQMLAGRSPRLFRDGSQSRDQVSVDDVVDCTMRAAEEGARPGVYNLGSGRATSFNEIVGALRRAMRIGPGMTIDAGSPGRDPAVTDYFDMPAEVRAFYQDYTCADMSHTRAGLGWSPRHDPLEAIAEYGRYLAARRVRD